MSSVGCIPPKFLLYAVGILGIPSNFFLLGRFEVGGLIVALLNYIILVLIVEYDHKILMNIWRWFSIVPLCLSSIILLLGPVFVAATTSSGYYIENPLNSKHLKSEDYFYMGIKDGYIFMATFAFIFCVELLKVVLITRILKTKNIGPVVNEKCIPEKMQKY